MLDVACVLWGDDWADGRGPEYAEKLRRAVLRNLTLEHRFICIADERNQYRLAYEGFGGEVWPLDCPSRLGIIPKLCVYNPRYAWNERVVVMDLDSLVIGNLDEMFSYPGGFAVRKALLSRPLKQFKMIGGDLIAFPAGFGHMEIWKKLCDNTGAFENDSMQGDERYIYARRLVRDEAIIPDFWQDMYPGQYRSFKFNDGEDCDHTRNELPLDNTRLVSFHGKPRIHEVLHIPYVRENWI